MLRSMKYGLYGAVVAGLVSVPAVWGSVDKSVDLVVDGRAATVQTTAATVGQLLSAKGYRVDSHDLVAPSTSTSLRNGSHVVLRHGHLLRLTVDGAHHDVWTTEPTVAQAVAALGYTDQDTVSVSRSQRLPLTPTAFTIRTPQQVTVVHDGVRQQVTTTEPTVADLLRQLGLTIGPLDRLSAPADATVVPGSTISLQRVVERTRFRTVSVAFPTVHRDDSELTSGLTKVVRSGRNGTARVRYVYVYVDGTLAGRSEAGSTTLVAPKTRIVSVGTMRSAKPDPGSAKAIAQQLLAARGWSDQYDCLVQMWNRESGWRTNAANPSGAYGIPQALPGSKMASAGPNWQTDAKTQISWGLGYIAARYGTPCGAWSFWQAHDYY